MASTNNNSVTVIESETVPKFILYSDGGGERSSAAGAAAIVEDLHTGDTRKLVAVLGPGTNNEAEICAGLIGYSCLRAMLGEKLRSRPLIEWVCDSEYVLKSATAYIHGWQRNGWRTADKKPVKNQGLWRTYLSLASGLTITPKHVRGHSGHPENEACDRAATWARIVGPEMLRTSQDGVLVQIDRNLYGEDWLVLDARQFLTELRAENPLVESQNAIEMRISEIFGDRASGSVMGLVSGRADNLQRKADSAPIDAELRMLEPVLERLRQARTDAKALATSCPPALSIARAIDNILSEFD